MKKYKTNENNNEITNSTQKVMVGKTRLKEINNNKSPNPILSLIYFLFKITVKYK
ncbi:hypothetical protein [Flavobacterium sp. HNIBRBA15423]|uniref:hypothetical protein n=1 Tax=Flavobacterium sp. HNIBRBA15423 TaxID=3458683 RepID=UPI004043FDAF